MSFRTNTVKVQAFAGAMYGIQVGSTTMAQITADITSVGGLANALNGYYTSSFGSVANATVATTVATNLGITGTTALADAVAYITAQLNAAAPSARGAVISNILDLFAGGTADATYGAFATAYNTKVAAAAAYTGTDNVAIGTVVAAAAVAFNLTTGTDKFTGTTANDSFDAGLSTSSLQTLNSGDQLDGGDGADELYAIVTASVTPSTIKNLETIYVTNTSTTAVATVDFSNATGITSLVNQSSTFGTTLAGISKAVAVTVKDTTLAAQTVTYNDVTGSADEATINVSNLSSNATLVVAGVEALTLNVTGTSNSTLAGSTFGSTTTLNITGTTGIALGTLGTTVNALNASGNTAAATGVGVTAVMSNTGTTTITGSAGNDSLTLGTGTSTDSVDGGAGNDSIIFTANFTTTDSVNGGDGTADELRLIAGDFATASASTPTTYTVTNIETLAISTALGTTSYTPANISATATTLNVRGALDTAITAGANTITGPAGTFTIGLGQSSTAAAGTNDAGVLGANTLTIADTGSATTDSLTIKNNATDASTGIDVFNGATLTVSGYETVTVNTGSTTGVRNDLAIVTITGDTGGTSAETLKVTGVNPLMLTGAQVVDIIDASALTATGTAATTGNAAFEMTIAGSATTITGSSGYDIIYTSSSSSSVDGGASDDSITSGAGNDTILGGAGADSIIAAAGNDNIDGGAGNDRVEISGLTENDTISGGADTDTLAITAAYTDGASLASAVSNFEVLELATGAAQAVAMSNFINNGTFTRVDFGNSATGTVAVSNAPATVTDIRFLSGATGDTFSFDRLIDNSSNSVTISSRADFATAGAVTAFTDLDSETISISGSSSANDLTLTTLTVSDLTTLNVTGSADIIITDAIAGGTKIATVDASTSTGAVTINASNTVTTVTATAGSGVFTFTGGYVADSITGGTAADVLVGGAGNDTISGGSGADAITGGAGGDSMTGGSGADSFVTASGSSPVATATSLSTTIAAGDTLTFGSGIDVITDFTSGTDTVNVTGTDNGTVTSLVGLTAATNLTANTQYYASGTFIASTGQFIISANAGGADTLIVDSIAAGLLSATTSAVVIVGVVSSTIVTNVATDFS